VKVSVVAIPHPELDNLFLHGKRRDNKKWTIPGGGADKGESALKCAIRELEEETGLKIKKLNYWGKKTVTHGKQRIEVSLFTAKCPKDLKLLVGDDPDQEMMHFKFLDPLTHGNMHVPMDSNILRDYLNDKKR